MVEKEQSHGGYLATSPIRENHCIIATPALTISRMLAAPSTSRIGYADHAEAMAVDDELCAPPTQRAIRPGSREIKKNATVVKVRPELVDI